MNIQTKILKDRLTEIREILLELEFLRNDIKSIINTKVEYKKSIVSKSRFFYRLHLNYIKLFVIDIYKITGKNEDYNLGKVIEFCKINRKKIDWHYKISLEKLNLLSKELDRISDKFEKIKDLRNTNYAHNDKNKNKFVTELTLFELWDVLDGLQDIFSRLNVDFDNLHWIFKIQYTQSNIIPNLYKYDQLHQLIASEVSKNNSTIEINELLKITMSN